MIDWLLSNVKIGRVAVNEDTKKVSLQLGLKGTRLAATVHTDDVHAYAAATLAAELSDALFNATAKIALAHAGRDAETPARKGFPHTP
jgi:hypothetical protein